MFRLYGQSELTLKINLFDVVYMKNLNIVVFDFKLKFLNSDFRQIIWKVGGIYES